MRRRFLPVLLLLGVAAAACGGDGAAPSTTGGAQTTSDGTEALIADLAGRLAASGSLFDAEAAECFARGMVEEVGVIRLISLGAAEPGDGAESLFARMTSAEVDVVAGLGLDCLDMEALLAERFVAQGLPSETASCIAAGVAEAPFLEELVAAAMLGEEFDPAADPAFVAAVTDLVGACTGG
ncbi:MAG: hypothetical protein JW785_09115 [Acidimicrobiia bacterium]|nr:hypothetical protein [Acidimicrobiia bacterium]